MERQLSREEQVRRILLARRAREGWEKFRHQSVSTEPPAPMPPPYLPKVMREEEPTERRAVPSEISWSSGNRIVFEEASRLDAARAGLNESAYYAVYEFTDSRGKGRTVDLSRVLGGEHTLLFSGGNSFYARDVVQAASLGGKPTHSVIAVDPLELEADERQMLSVFHEVGHCRLYEGLDKKVVELVQKPWPKEDSELVEKVKGIQHYVDALPEKKDALSVLEEAGFTGVSEEHRGDLGFLRKLLTRFSRKTLTRRELTELRQKSHDIDDVVKIFHERFAWAYAFRLMRQLDASLGFEADGQAVEYAHWCLGTYARARRDERFVEGMSS